MGMDAKDTPYCDYEKDGQSCYDKMQESVATGIDPVEGGQTGGTTTPEGGSGGGSGGAIAIVAVLAIGVGAGLVMYSKGVCGKKAQTG